MGARVLFGDLNFKMQDSNLKDGYYFYPMIIDNVSKDSPAYHEELFAPVFTLFRFS